MMNKISVAITTIILTFSLAGCVATGKAVYVQVAEMGEDAEIAKSMEFGATSEMIIEKAGKPDRIFISDDGKNRVLLYCEYGFTTGTVTVYWIDKAFGYYHLQELRDYPESPIGNAIWEDGDAPVIFDCHTRARVNWANAPESPSKPFGWDETVFDIDLLRITHLRAKESECASGTLNLIKLDGQIGPDSSFAVEQLLQRLDPCLDELGATETAVEVQMNSGGGFLEHGFILGRTLKHWSVKAVIADGAVCASSCAVAFLGGATRAVSEKGQILFHAPYFSGKNEYGERDIDCDVGEESLNELKDYYISMTDTETGERLFERTMWYCSAEDGWVVTGGAAAELYGIATER